MIFSSNTTKHFPLQLTISIGSNDHRTAKTMHEVETPKQSQQYPELGTFQIIISNPFFSFALAEFFVLPAIYHQKTSPEGRDVRHILAAKCKGPFDLAHLLLRESTCLCLIDGYDQVSQRWFMVGSMLFSTKSIKFSYGFLTAGNKQTNLIEKFSLTFCTWTWWLSNLFIFPPFILASFKCSEKTKATHF